MLAELKAPNSESLKLELELEHGEEKEESANPRRPTLQS
jgi:hypothetical protein